MQKPRITLDTAITRDGTLALVQHDKDYVISLDGRILMTSRNHGSETALGTLACAGLSRSPGPRVLIGGLGMAFTLRAVLDALPETARVEVAELNPIIVAWCRGPIANITAHSVDDKRVTVTLANFAEVLAEHAAKAPGTMDAIAIDLYVGPDSDTRPDDPLYGQRVTERAFKALKPGGIFAVWGEAFHAAYEKRLQSVGFTAGHERPARGSTRAVVYVAKKPSGGKPR